MVGATTKLTQSQRTERVVWFKAGDETPLNLINVHANPTKGPVLLIHGSGVRANLFRPPVDTTLVDALVDAGYDVWLENWRASIDFDQPQWTLDDGAVFDHPAAVQRVLRETGADSLKAIVHCQGSTSFCMSAAAGLLPEVETIVSSAVSFHPVVPWLSRVKMRALYPIASAMFSSLNSDWASRPDDLPSMLYAKFADVVHRSCDVPECKLISEMYGAGSPALWRHENLNDETHRVFIPREFGEVPMSFFKQIRAGIFAGQLVSTGELDHRLPARFVDQAPRTDARFVFFTGSQNRTFDASGQVASFEWMRSVSPQRHALHLFEGYSHLDVFLGKSAAEDIFPTLIAELDAPS